jgi:hypothetical protein
VCATELEEIPAPLPLHGCRSCGGAWLGPEAAVHLLRDPDDTVNQAVVAASRKIPFQHEVHPERLRVCALCAQPMSALYVGPIRLETCPHGTWFDRDEVREASRTLEAKRHEGEWDPLRALIGVIERWYS